MIPRLSACDLVSPVKDNLWVVTGPMGCVRGPMDDAPLIRENFPPYMRFSPVRAWTAPRVDDNKRRLLFNVFLHSMSFI